MFQAIYSSGFDKKEIQDKSMHAISHRYGKSTIPRTAGSMAENEMTTIARMSFRKPFVRKRPNFRTSSMAQEQFDLSMVTKPKDQGLQSGFTINAKEFDGSSWVPEKCLHGNLQKTEYRNRFN